MNNPQKIREIYLELKIALGDSESDSDLLKAASELVQSFNQKLDNTPKTSIAEFRRDFLSLDLTSAMADGGWQIMRRESELMHNFYTNSSESEVRLHFGHEVNIDDCIREIVA